MGAPETAHSWAYLPDLGAAFERLASGRETLSQLETLHFAGHFVTNARLTAAIAAAAPVQLRPVPLNWTMLSLLGLAMPVMREITKMRYLWDNTMQLVDPRLDTLLGDGFGMPFEAAVAAVAGPFFAPVRAAA